MSYSEKYLQHFSAPQNVGEIENPDKLCEVEHQGGGCFDRVRLTLKMDGNTISDAQFKARACSGTIAACSAATEWAHGKRLEEAAKITGDDVAELLGGVPEKKQHSVDLAAEALRTAALEILS